MSKTNTQFAETYEGCQVVANIMGLNVETVRKRAKAGKIPAKQNERGTWVFSHADLVAHGIAPFVAAGPISSGQTLASILAPKKTNYTSVIFVLDRSGSMTGMESRLRSSLIEQIGELKKASSPTDLYNVSVINFDTEISTTVNNVPVGNLIADGALYLNPRGGTALNRAILKAIETAQAHDNGRDAFLISILTDGGETENHMLAPSVAQKVRQLTGTDRYTFTYAGPSGSGVAAAALGILSGNITTWDTTVAGLGVLAATSRTSLNSYTESRSRGVMRSESFYAQPITQDAAKFAGQIAGKLDDVTSKVHVERITASDPLKISDFAKAKFGAFTKGELYYELTESEKVQDYKGIVVQDKTKGQFFSGWASAKQLLGIPNFQGTVNIKPGSLGDFKVFVQSTSLNRKLEPGTALVRLV